MSAAKTHPGTTVFPDRRRLGGGIAAYVAHRAAKASEREGRFHVALSGGSLLEAIVPPLTSPPLRDAIDWSAWHVFWVDERGVPFDSPDSNHGTALRYFFRRVPIPSRQIFGMDTALDPGEAARDYAAQMVRVFGTASGRRPPFDLILLGVGEDGHTASLFPGHPVLAETRQWVTHVYDAPKPPPVRLTMTLPIINYARHVAFMAAGARKAKVIAAIFGSKDATPAIPATLVRPSNGTLKWFLDEAAAAQVALHPACSVGAKRPGQAWKVIL